MGLPDGVTLGMVLGVLIPAGLVTFALRALPFVFLKTLKSSPLVSFLAVLMPVGVMTVLVVYSMLGYSASLMRLGAAALSLVVTLLLHWWRRRADLSILTGTLLYMLLVNVVL